MTKELKQKYTLKITQANKTQLITILYEMLLLYMEEAVLANDKQNKDEFREAIRKSRGCVDELLASLNFEYELALNFLQLYLFVNSQLITAQVSNHKEPIEHAKKVIKELHQAYEKLEKNDVSGPVMGNVQTVYAGLTYGKSNLNENLADQGIDRGFRA